MSEQLNWSIQCQHLTKTYGAKERAVTAVDDVSLRIPTGSFTAVIGKSGSGKSTLLSLLSGLIPPDSGSVTLLGQDMTRLPRQGIERMRREQIGFIFQNYQLLPELTVYENIILPRILGGQKLDEPWTKELLDLLGLTQLAHRYPNQLSGGQQQLTAIGRAFLNRPQIIFADEPTGNLDSQTGEMVLDLMLQLRQMYGPTILMVTHDLKLAGSADSVLQMERGRLVFQEEAQE